MDTAIRQYDDTRVRCVWTGRTWTDGIDVDGRGRTGRTWTGFHADNFSKGVYLVEILCGVIVKNVFFLQKSEEKTGAPKTRETWKPAHCTMQISLWLRPWCKSYSGRCPPYGRIHTPAQAWQQIVRWSCFL